jgi:hypothetical protein
VLREADGEAAVGLSALELSIIILCFSVGYALPYVILYLYEERPWRRRE